MVWTSLFGIITIILLARALGFGKTPTIANTAEASRIAADALHDFRPAESALATDHRGALVAGTDGRIALVRPFGDRWVVRVINGAAASISGDVLRVTPAEPMFPPANLRLGPAAHLWASRL